MLPPLHRPRSPGAIEKVVVDFGTTWKQSRRCARQRPSASLQARRATHLERGTRRGTPPGGGGGCPALLGVNARLAVAFATPVCSQAVLHLVFKQLLVDYSRFLVIIEKRYGTGQARGRGACSARGSPDLTSSGGAARTAPRGGGGRQAALAATSGCHSARRWWTWKRCGLRSKSSGPTQRERRRPPRVASRASFFFFSACT